MISEYVNKIAKNMKNILGTLSVQQTYFKNPLFIFFNTKKKEEKEMDSQK